MVSISYINPYFLTPSPLKPLKIELTTSKSTWGITYSSFRPQKRPKTVKFDQKMTKNRPMLTFVSFMKLS